MSYQFIHVEAYGRKASANKGRKPGTTEKYKKETGSGGTVSSVLDEVERKPGACPHVENPREPDLVYGMPISELRAEHDQACETMKYEVAGGGKPRAVRVDQKTLFTVVASHELTPQEIEEDPSKKAAYEAWERDTITWLQKEYGDSLKSVVRHSDESHMHIHAYGLSQDLRAANMHPGYTAKVEAKAQAQAEGLDAKTSNKIGDAAYVKAMRDYQDRYHEEVGMRHGLTRLGPGNRRKSRPEWQQEQKQSKALAKALEQAEALKKEGSQYVAKVNAETSAIKKDAAAEKAEAARLKAEADARKAEADRLAQEAEKARKQAEKDRQDALKIKKQAKAKEAKIIGSAKAEAEKLTSIANKFRSIWDGLRESALVKKIRKEFQDQLKSKDAVIDRLSVKAEEEAQRGDKLELTLKRKDKQISELQSEIEVLKPKPTAVPKLNSQTRRHVRNADDDYQPSAPRM